MKYLLLPIHLFKFWYIESLVVFGRAWKNLILYLEEDLAVGLMIKLLFVPLFHDSSIVGRALSFIFRLVRILIGLFAFSLATTVVLILVVGWLLLPGLVILGLLGEFGVLGWVIIFSGVGLFLIHTFESPHKKVWEIKNPIDIWQATLVKKKDLTTSMILADLEVKNLLSYLETNSNKFTPPAGGLIFSESLLPLAFELAKKGNSPYIAASHIFVASVKANHRIENELLKDNLEVSDFEGALFYLEKKKSSWRRVYLWDSDFAIRHLKGVNRGWLGAPTPFLDQVSRDLTREAAKTGFQYFVGRMNIVTEVVHLLSTEGRRNVILVGPPGTGKTALIQHLAKVIIAGDAPPSLATKRLVLLDLTRLLSGVTTEGQLADRIKNIFEEISFTQNVILAVEEIHNLGLGEAENKLNLYSLMLPYLESSDFQFIGTTEETNYAKTLEKNGAFARLFTKVELPPASTDETLQILEDQAIQIERKTGKKVSFLSLKTAVELSSKLIHDRVLPDSAVSLLEEAESEVSDGWINSEVIKQVVSHRVNVPVAEVGNVERDKLLNLESEIHQRLIDQEEAVKGVADSLRRSATGLRETSRPIGSFLFVGPTGVGKTELAKILAEVYFKTGGAYIRFDMSEYQLAESVSQLIGGSANQLGQLTEAIRIKPYSLILLDEFEKADPKILTLFLQILEDGRLTDFSGKHIDFTNSIIIATSNAASLTIANGLGQGRTLEDLKSQVSGELLKIFRPELINRFDGVILFKPLTQQHLQQIVGLKLRELQAQLKKQGYVVEFDKALVSELAKKGFDPVLGARPLRRLIQDTLEAKLSKMILENKLTKGQTFKMKTDFLVVI